MPKKNIGQNIKHLSFDFDGVIVNSNFVFTKEFIFIGKSFTGREVLATDIYASWGATISDLLEKFYPEIDLITYLRERERLGFHLVIPDLVPGAHEALKLLSKKFTLSIVTNREKSTLFEIIEKNQINTALFEKIQPSDDTDFDKPHPRVFDDLLVRHKARETAYVGDHHKADYLAASGAGIHFIGVLSGGISTQKDFLAAGVPEHMILDSLAYLPPLFGL